MKKVVISIASIILLITTLFFFSYNNNDSVGTISIILVNNTDQSETKQFTFKKEDSLFDIIDRNFSVVCGDRFYTPSTTCEKVTFGSRVIFEIDDLITDFETSFIAIYENDVYSNLGIDSIILNDGDSFRFEYKEVGGS